jgi:anti-sigma regulatory factor (Ser/Thr protein kinase)
MFGSEPQVRIAINGAGSLHEVRDRLRGLAPESADPVWIEDVLLVASELASNAVLHTAGPVELAAWCAPDGAWRVEVADESAIVPVVQDVPPLQPNGRGLRIVQALATSWGVVRTRNGKRCWVEVLPQGRNMFPG